MNDTTLSSNTLSDEQIERLETLLEDPIFEPSMFLDEIQAYLCAALTGPRPMPPDRWLLEVLGNEEILETGIGIEVAGLLRSFADQLKATLDESLPFSPVLYDSEDEEGNDLSYQTWCQAYLLALDSAEEDWFDALGVSEDKEANEEALKAADFIDERLFPILVLAGDAESAAREAGDEWPEGEELKALQDECQEILVDSVLEIHAFWRHRRAQHRQ